MRWNVMLLPVLIGAAALVLVACGGNDPASGSAAVSADARVPDPAVQLPRSKGKAIETAAVTGKGSPSDTVQIPTDPTWWGSLQPEDRLVVLYSSDVHGEIEPCG